MKEIESRRHGLAPEIGNEILLGGGIEKQASEQTQDE